jgi:hypothetical protein
VTGRDAHWLVALEALNTQLEADELEAELCLVGGAVIVLAFAAQPDTRNVKALFRSTQTVAYAADRVARELGLPEDWVDSAVRELLGAAGSGLGPFVERSNLRVYEARPEYALAMKAAGSDLETEREVDSDLGYLTRSIGVRTAPEALERIERYFNPRQLPPSLEGRLRRLLG